MRFVNPFRADKTCTDFGTGTALYWCQNTKEDMGMTTMMTVRSVLEILTAVALVVGFFFEDKVADWERRMLYRIKKRLGRSNVLEFHRKRSPQDGSRAI